MNDSFVNPLKPKKTETEASVFLKFPYTSAA